MVPTNFMKFEINYECSVLDYMEDFEFDRLKLDRREVRQLRFHCRTCPYFYAVEQKLTRKDTFSKKQFAQFDIHHAGWG